MNLNELTDVTYETDNGLAWITINRPDRYNAFRGRTVDCQNGTMSSGGRASPRAALSRVSLHQTVSCRCW